MKNYYKVLFYIVLHFCTFSAMTQKFALGLEMDLSIGFAEISAKSTIPRGPFYSYTTWSGLNGGVDLICHLSRGFDLRTGVLERSKNLGTAWNFTNCALSGIATFNTVYKVVEIPIVLIWKIPLAKGKYIFKPQAGLGFSLNRAMEWRTSVTSVGTGSGIGDSLFMSGGPETKASTFFMTDVFAGFGFEKVRPGKSSWEFRLSVRQCLWNFASEAFDGTVSNRHFYSEDHYRGLIFRKAAFLSLGLIYYPKFLQFGNRKNKDSVSE